MHGFYRRLGDALVNRSSGLNWGFSNWLFDWSWGFIGRCNSRGWRLLYLLFLNGSWLLGWSG
jgi:hypothetical protein